MNTKSRKSDPPQAKPISIRAKEGRVPPRLRYEQSEEHPSDIPDSIRAQGPPNFLGLTSSIPEGSPKVACVNHVLATPHHPEPFQEDTSPPHLGLISPSCHLVSWQPGHPPRSAGISHPWGHTQLARIKVSDTSSRSIRTPARRHFIMGTLVIKI